MDKNNKKVWVWITLSLVFIIITVIKLNKYTDWFSVGLSVISLGFAVLSFLKARDVYQEQEG